MPTFTTVDATWDTGVTLDAAELKRADTAMFLGDGTANGVRGGIVRHGDTSLAVSVNGSDQVTVQPGAFVIPAATGLGVYRGSLQTAVGPSAGTALTARNGTNPRIDLIVMQATGTNATLKTIDGTPSASPSAPGLLPQHIEIARATVPQVGGGAVIVDSSFRSYATGLGGVLFAESLARLPGSGNQKGQRATALDTGMDYRWSGTAWLPKQSPVAAANYGTPTTILTASTTNPTLGTASSATARFSRDDNMIDGVIEVICGTGSTAVGSGTYQFLLPATPRAGTIAPLGYGGIKDGTTISAACTLYWSTGTIANLYLHGFGAANNGLGEVAVNRRYLIAFRYEAA